MQVIELSGEFGLDRLKIADRLDPLPGSGQISIRLRAASLNYRDLMMVRGLYNPGQPLPLVPCSDGVGVVEHVGKGVRDLAVGDRVCTLFAQSWMSGPPDRSMLGSTLGGPLDGTLSERMVLDAHGVVPAPEHLSDAEASTLTCAGLTAWSALVTLGRLQEGDTVLVQGTGGVAIFALQFATMLGARVIVTSSSPAKLERAVSLGAWETIDYVRHPGWGKIAREMTGGSGVDLVVEVGGAGTLEQSLSAVRPGGTVALIGVLAGGQSELNIVPILMQQIRVQGILVGHREGFLAMNRKIVEHRLRPVVHRILPWIEARDALESLASATHVGKICLSFDAPC